jgi:carbamoyl-phosphate synthase large subunit
MLRDHRAASPAKQPVTMHARMIRLLISSVGSLVGQNVLETLTDRRSAFHVAGTTSVSKFALDRCDCVYLVPETAAPPSAFQRRFTEVFERERPDLVLPGRDADVTVLAEMAATDPALAARLACGNAASARLFEDKWLSHGFACEHGLGFAPSAVASGPEGIGDVESLAERHGFPLIAKPRLGFASRDVRLIHNRRQLDAAVRQPGLIFQEYLGDASRIAAFRASCEAEGLPLHYSLEADKFAVQTLVRRDGQAGRIFCTRQAMRAGRSVEVQAIDSPQLQQLGADYARAFAAAGWRGPLNIQCQLSAAGRYCAYELNGRLTGATAARYFLGYDEVATILEDLSGRPAPKGHSPGARLPLKFHKTAGVRLEDCASLEQRLEWHAPTQPSAS